MKHLSISSFEMKRFLKNIVLCGIPMLLFLIVVEAVVRSAPNDYKYKWTYLEEHSKDIETLVLGNSQSYYGIDCNYLQGNSFNMAMEGQGLLIDDFVLDGFIDRMTNLKGVIIPISYLSLTQSEGFGTPGRLMQYHIYYKYDSKWYSKDNYECLNFTMCSKKIKTLASGKGFRYVDSLGFCNKPTGSFRDEADETLAWSTGGNDRLEIANKNALVHMARLCREKDVKMVVVSFPTDISYRKSPYFDSSQMNHVRQVAADLSEEFENVFFVDWFENPDFETSDFFDSSHLNGQGAKKLSVLLDSKLKELQQGVI